MWDSRFENENELFFELCLALLAFFNSKKKRDNVELYFLRIVVLVTRPFQNN